MRNSHQPKEYVQLKGQIERVTFTSEESGYSVVKVKVYGRKELEIDRELLRTAVKQLDSMQKVVLENKLSDEGNAPKFMVYLDKTSIFSERLNILRII